MPTSTYVALATVTLAATDTSITFSSIPASYRDLILVMDYSINSTGGEARIEINADSGSNYPEVRMINANTGFLPSGANSATATNTYLRPGVSPASAFWSEIQFLDYSDTNKQKPILTRTNNQDEYVVAKVSRWADTTAISSLRIFTSANNFTIGSTFNLYAIAS